MSFFYKHPTEYKAHLTHEGQPDPPKRAWRRANNTYAFSIGLGIVEVTIGLLTLAGLVSRRVGLVGAAFAFVTPLITRSFLVTTPESWVQPNWRRSIRVPWLFRRRSTRREGRYASDLGLFSQWFRRSKAPSGSTRTSAMFWTSRTSHSPRRTSSSGL